MREPSTRSWRGHLADALGAPHRPSAGPRERQVLWAAEKAFIGRIWNALDRGGKPRGLRPGEHILDELDVADLVSERAHSYSVPGPGTGFVDFRVLGDLIDRKRDLFDAGLGPFPIRPLQRCMRMPADGGRLVVRTAVAQSPG